MKRETENSSEEKLPDGKTKRSPENVRRLKSISPHQLLFLQALDPMNLRRRKSVNKSTRLLDDETVNQTCDIPDAELIEDYTIRHNSKAFELLYMRRKPKMLAYLNVILRNEEDAKDVLQNAWLTVLHYFANHLYREEDDFAGWFKGICYHRAKEWMRESRKFYSGGDQLPDHADSSMSVEQRLENNECEWLLQNGLNRLTENERQIVMLRIYERRSFYEIAVARNITEDAARSRYSKTLKKLKKALS